MNTGTKLRTALAIATSLNTALLATDITSFENPTLDLWYKVASIILNFIIVAIATYYNNDYTDEAMIGTDVTRMLKVDPEAMAVVETEDGYEADDPEEDEEADDEME